VPGPGVKDRRSALPVKVARCGGTIRSVDADIDDPGWTFLTNHGHVLVCIAKNADVRISEIAAQVGIGERAAQGIVTDLVEGGYVTRTRVGRRNHYMVNPTLPLRHPLERDHQVGELLHAVATPDA
jgi:predicted transcriptional regulator